MGEVAKRDPRGQGDQGELSAVAWFKAQGADVFIPFGHARDLDLVAHFGGGLVGVQVKTSSRARLGRWEVAVRTSGGNQSWNGVVKRLDPSRYDFLFVLVGDGRRWFIPADQVGGGCLILLGGPKYARYEIERGQPLRPAGWTLDSATPWRDSRAVKGDAL